MNYASDQNQFPNRAARRRKTALSIKNKGGVGGSHIAVATATVLRMSGAGVFTTAIVDLDGSTGTAISRMGEREPDGSISIEQSLAEGARDPGTGGWPVFTGGRYQKLCFSPVFDALHDAKRGDGEVVPYRLPTTAADFVAYVESITGISQSEHDDLARIYRFDPVELFDACNSMRRACPPAWRLVLSYAFGPAQRLWPGLRDVQQMSQFHYPLIDAFRILADFERASLIMRHLGRARTILDRPNFLQALASPVPLGTRYGSRDLIEVRRWIEYACFSSGALTELLFARDTDEVLALPGG